MADTEILGGAGFLLEPAGTRPIFTPEAFSDEQTLFYRTALEFMEREVLPKNERIEKMEDGLLPTLIGKAGELGILGIDVPEQYGGLGLDKTTSALVGEALAMQASFAVALGVQTGIGTLPILIFGTEEQKHRYLPALVTGSKISAYCLSEPGSGSDALGARTTAVRDGDAYVLNGVKAWISNAGFADVYIVFAQVDGDKFTAFIVERGAPGLSTGAEEKKMGLKGSSTRQVILDGVRVPIDNVLGQIGQGHVIAFNILNIGRYKLGIAGAGGGKAALKFALDYAGERKQFGTRLIDFPAIREKLARMATSIYTTETMGYRLTGMLDGRIEALDKEAPDHWKLAADIIKDYAIECSILKVQGSEGVSAVLDEALQIFGGYGFTSDYPIEQRLRDSRVNRIFEGTNEINRMLIPGSLFKRVMQGRLNLMPAVAAVEAEVRAAEPASPPDGDDTMALARFMTEQAKKVFLFTAGAAVQKYMASLDQQQELLMIMADMVIDVFGADSVVARVGQRIAALGEEKTAPHRAVALVVTTEAYRRVAERARDVAGHIARNPGKMIAGIDRLAPYVPVDLIGARRAVAEHLIAMDRYRF
ncbi:MAG: acyl-CoA dehydrogenase family protein [Myxococcales bacterium]|nr:acyl-CoA dehydrogenase family protein [Myxococcales bacterium]MCB9552974.1 acyl-CoA dehydrogenase family protein [Myxococcales bacterium]